MKHYAIAMSDLWVPYKYGNAASGDNTKSIFTTMIVG